MTGPAPTSICIDSYEWAGGREAMLRFGPQDGPLVVAALPLFEEANRTRAFTVTILRALAKRGIGGVLPDLPGQGESLVALETVSLESLRQAHHDLVEQLWAGKRRTYALGVRSGAVLDAGSHLYGRWHLAPQDGPTLLRELTRIRQAALGPTNRLGAAWWFGSIDAAERDVPVEIAGNLIAPGLLAELMDRPPPISGPIRTVRLASDKGTADRHVEGAPLWRRSEPGQDHGLSQLLAHDFADWVATCGG